MAAPAGRSVPLLLVLLLLLVATDPMGHAQAGVTTFSSDVHTEASATLPGGPLASGDIKAGTNGTLSPSGVRKNAACIWTGWYAKTPGYTVCTCTITYSAYSATNRGSWCNNAGYSYVSLSTSKPTQQLAYVCASNVIALKLCL